MRSVLRSAWSVVVIVAALSVATTAAAKTYSAERFDSHVRLLAGGTVEVTETVVFRFESGTFDHVVREISARRTDGIEIISASLDGRSFPRGGGVNQIEVTGDSKVKVRWRFQPIAGSSHVFVLTYLARGVVSQTAGGDVLAWRALPGEHQYKIESSTVSFELPASVAPADAASGLTPKMEWHRIGGPVDVAVARASQDSAAAPLVTTATARQIQSNGWIEATFDLPPGSILTTLPAWQQAQETARGLAPRWITAAVIVALSGLIVLFGLRQQYDAPVRDQVTIPGAAAVPDSLAAGLVGPLLSNGRAGHDHAMATLVALADRGVISIEERPRGMLGQHSFDVRRRATHAALAGHESTLLEIGLAQAADGEAVPLNSVRRRLLRRSFRRFSTAVQQDLIAAGLIDLDRKRVRDRYVRFSIGVLILAGVAVAGVGAVLVDRFEAWPMLLPAALGMVAMAALIFAAATTPLSNEGMRRAARWRGFREYLKSVSHNRDLAPAQGVQSLLPFAVATGLAASWTKYLKRHPGSVPTWFRELSGGSADTAFTAFLSSTSSGGHGGGVSAGGAAGGGSSSAG